MVLLILGIGLILLVTGIVILDRTYNEALGGFLATIGLFSFVGALIAAIILGISVMNLSTIDERIAMYQEENVKIEEQIENVVEQYQQYESDIFAEAKPNSSVELVALYPELKSDTLVQKQIEIYLENNKKIKSLREQQIAGSVDRWWLYFGE